MNNWKIDEKEQRELVEYVFELLRLTYNKFTYFTTHHPFMIPMGPQDTRLGVAFRNSPLFSLTSGSHEAGHAVYEANMSYKNSIIGEAPSTGIHESQSLFWESHVVSSRNFVNTFYKTIQEKSDGYLNSIDVETFYKYYNHITKSLIRIEGDELTYPLHIIIRYEIERDLFNRVISFDELEDVWNKKYEQYFGKTPTTSKNGFMQDVHWSEGMFGYFPTYLIGRIYASQVEQELKEKLSNFDELVSSHSFDEILKVLQENIYSVGSLKTTPQIFKDFTGSELDSSVYITYLKKKYFEMYGVVK